MNIDAPLVYIVEDDAASRDSLRYLLESAGYRVKEYATAEHFLATYQPALAACAVLDVRMPGMNGLQLHEEMIRSGHAIPVIFITGHGDVRMAVNAVRKGAVDFIEKPFDDMEFLSMVERAITLNGPSFQGEAKQIAAALRLATLTQREHEVMELVISGKQNKMIAAELAISAKTVETHRARVMEKTCAKSVAELVQLALDARNAPPVRPHSSS